MKNGFKLAAEIAKLSAWTYVWLVVGSAALIQLDRTASAASKVVNR